MLLIINFCNDQSQRLCSAQKPTYLYIFDIKIFVKYLYGYGQYLLTHIALDRVYAISPAFLYYFDNIGKVKKDDRHDILFAFVIPV